MSCGIALGLLLLSLSDLNYQVRHFKFLKYGLFIHQINDFILLVFFIKFLQAHNIVEVLQMCSMNRIQNDTINKANMFINSFGDFKQYLIILPLWYFHTVNCWK